MFRILILTPQMPYPPAQGTSLRNYNIIRGLAKNHDVSLLTYIETDERLVELPEAPNCKILDQVPVPRRTSTDRTKQLITNSQPDMALRLRSDRFVEALKVALINSNDDNLSGQSYDFVQIEGIELAFTIPTIRQYSPNSKIVFDDHNAESELQRRAFQIDLSHPHRWPAAAYSFIQARRLHEYESWVISAVDWVVAVSQADKDHLLKLVKDKPITVIPNCIDVSNYREEESQTNMQYDLLFTGKMDYRPNIDAVLWFSTAIWPLIQKARPNTTWAIVGQNPHRRLNSLANLKNVTVTGRVKQVQPYFATTKVFIMPFRLGSGTRLKMIEAMASGKAIVSTTIGAEGYSIRNNHEIMLADNPTEFASIVLSLLEDPELRTRLGNRAQLYAQQYDWRKVIPLFDGIYSCLLD